jgi:carbonic anhydrase
VPADIPVYGFIYDVKSGKLIEVEEATEAGRARELTPPKKVAKKQA